MADNDDDDDDFGCEDWDADADELIAAAITQAEQQALHPSCSLLQQAPPDAGAPLFLEGAFNSDEFDDGAFPDFTPSPPRVPAGPFRQTTLFGTQLPQNAPNGTPAGARRNWPLVNSQNQETPTHHKIDREAAKTWVYPANVSHRDYQYNIVHRALFTNLLVALPTGLGKTFIAATVMLNWFRWAPESQLVFMAPTKPLVVQQIEACSNICGIPKNQTAVMTGNVASSLRREYWEERRVFFMTPQTMENDIKNGNCDAKRIACVVIDEAHKASGSYAYVNVVKLLRRENTSFRVLALTATPGATVEAVQGVIDALGIAKVEIRTEESLDIRQYVHRRHVDIEVFELSEEITMLRDLFCKCLEPMLKKLNAQGYWQKDARELTPYGVMQAKQKWFSEAAGRNASVALKGMMNNLFSTLSSLAHPLGLLTNHGVRIFYNSLAATRAELEASRTKGGKNSILHDENFKKLMSRAQAMVNNPNFSGHPKLDHLAGAVLKHFAEAEEADEKRETRIMVFTGFRDSAEEIVKMLKRHEPMIRPHIFVGQAEAKASAGMSQKQQLETIKQFQLGTINTIVATSIGEEGLDIGEIDLIICYDSSSSPIRMLQRMGRTGRKRAGHILLLLTKGREEDSYKKATDNYQYMQKLIASGERFAFHHDTSPRILPKDIQPEVDKRVIEIPFENTQPEPKRTARRNPKPKSAKKFFMPEGVSTGFKKASKLVKGDDSDQEDEEEARERKKRDETPAPSLEGSETGLLTEPEQRSLQRMYQNIYGGADEVQTITIPRLDAFPDVQRGYTKTKHVKHGRATKLAVGMVQRMSSMDHDAIDRFRNNFDSELLKSPKKTTAFKPVRPAVVTKGLTERASNVPKPKPITTSTTAAKRKRKQKNSIDEVEGIDLTISSDEEDKGKEPEMSPPSPTDTDSLMGGSRKFPTGSSDDDDDELPDISDMIKDARKSLTPSGTGSFAKRKPVKETTDMRRGKRLRRVDDSDDD